MESRINARFDESIKQLRDLLTPLSETYTTATVLGKWLMGFFVLISIILGIVLSFQKLFNK